MKKIKQILSMLLVVCCVVTMIPSTVFASFETNSGKTTDVGGSSGNSIATLWCVAGFTFLNVFDMLNISQNNKIIFWQVGNCMIVYKLERNQKGGNKNEKRI